MLAEHLFVLGRVGRQFPRQAVSHDTVSHGAVFPLDDFPFLLGLPRSVKTKSRISQELGTSAIDRGRKEADRSDAPAAARNGAVSVF